jgi:tRNA (guanine37-N1)-methyltransferase
MSWQVQILTLFPEIFPGPLGTSLPGKALKDSVWQMEILDIRAFASDKHASVDDTPYGGGAGMVMRPDVVDSAIRGAETKFGNAARKIYLSPRGRVLDQRVMDAHALEEVSLGDFVLAGGEIAAMALLEACVRLLPGVLGNAATVEEESFEVGLLEYPHYTRPAVWNGHAIPEVLASGHHEKVKAWRQAKAEEITRKRRPDLYERYQLRHKIRMKETQS